MSNTDMAEITGLAKGLAKSAQQSDAGGGSFMKFTKFGEWTWGSESTEIEEGSLWAIHPQGFVHGWIAWGDKAHNNAGTKIGETMVAATEPLPFENELPEVKGSWAQQISMQMVCLDGMDKGTKVTFNSCSMGGRKIYQDIVNSVVSEINAGKQGICPVVIMSNSSYTHKDHGKIFTPVIEIDSWKTLPELNDMLSAMEGDEATEAAIESSQDAEEEAKITAADEKAKAEKAKAEKETAAKDDTTDDEPAPRRRRRRS